jgi:hypothetical protein
VHEALRDGERPSHTRQRSLISDISELTKPTLTHWFLSIQLLNRAKHKRMQAMRSHEQDLALSGAVAQRWWGE